MKCKVVIMGYYGFGNMGDEAILKGILNLINDNISDIDPLVLSKTPKITSKELGVKTSYYARGVTDFLVRPLQRLKTFIRTIKADLLIIGGGGLYHDYWNILPFGSIEIFFRLLLSKPTLIYSVGIGPYNNGFAQKIASLFIKCATIVSVRDEQSRSMLLRMGIKNVMVNCDPAIYLRGQVELTKDVFPTNKIKDFIVVSLRNWPGFEKYTDDIAKILDKIISDTKKNIIFIPFRVTDIYSITVVQNKMTNREYTSLLAGDYTPEEIISIISYASAVIGMRLHSLIFSLCAEIPFFGISYDPKIKNFCKEIYGNKKYFLDLEELLNKDVYEKIKSFLIARNDMKSLIEEKHNILRNKLLKNLCLISDLCNKITLGKSKHSTK